MGKIRIEKRFIDESIRIRKKYLDSLTELKEKEYHISQIKTDIIETYNIATDAVNEIDSEMMKIRIENLTKEVKKMQSYIEPIILNINRLQKDADNLFENIQEKYPNISKEDLISHISPHLLEIDENYDVFD